MYIVHLKSWCQANVMLSLVVALILSFTRSMRKSCMLALFFSQKKPEQRLASS
jgi:hypothetical protein